MVDNGWNEYQKLVLAELKRLSSAQIKHDLRLNEVRLEIATLRGRASVWGAIAGLLAGTVVAIVTAFIARG